MLSKGLAYEDLAHTYLLNQGLKPITQNFHSKYGEIDLVMRDKNTLVFIEVRFRKHSRFGSPAETITRNKQKKIIKTARHFLNQRKLWNCSCRFDVVSISLTANNKQPELDWLRAAFMADE